MDIGIVPGGDPPGVSTMSLPASPFKSAQQLLHELQVHQLELEMQNEDLRATRSALEESRDRFSDLFEFAPVGYLDLGLDGSIDAINQTGADMLKRERASLGSVPFDSLVSPQDSARWCDFFSRASGQAGPSSCELLLTRGDASTFHAKLDTLLSTTQRATFRVSMSDISELKAIQAELRIAATAFASPQAMVVTDSAGVILRVNEAFTNLTGFDARDLIGQKPSYWRSGRQDSAFYEQLWAALQSEARWQGVIWNRHKNGKLYAEWVTIAAIADPEQGVSHYLGSFSEITKNREAEAEIHRLAYYDALTHLPNRRLLHDRITQDQLSSSRSGRYGALLFLDLDNFKRLNDSRGHHVGDCLLIEAAVRIQSCLREGDTVARMGGDEFVVVLDGLSTDAREAAIQAGQVGEKIRLALARPYDLPGAAFHSSASIGATLFLGHDESCEILLKHADMAMYMAKSAGRNGLRFFDMAMQTTIDERATLESDLRSALESGQFRLYYQVQVDAEQQVIGVEALLRWLHPLRGTVTPGDFIAMAEDSGLILPIGQWVLDEACAQLASWAKSQSSKDLVLSINVSARQFREQGFVRAVQQALERHRVPRGRLKIELTESLMMDDINESIRRMLGLKELGVGIAMDDFGTGYSSLARLKRLPLDQLKIDRAFVHDLASADDAEAIVHAIIEMGRALGLQVVAEGVETQAQLDSLHRHGCDAFQGYLLGRPVDAGEFDAQMLNRAG